MTNCRGRLAIFILLFVGLPPEAWSAPPNIVLLLSDDQGWTDFGFMGHPHIRTPHLDQLSRESLTFTRGYVPDSLCRPSLMTLLTGRYPHQHGVVGNDPPPPAGLEKLPKGKLRNDPLYRKVCERYIAHIDDEQTWPGILQKQLGYVSLQTGKWWEGNYQRGGFTHGMSSGVPEKGGRHGDEGLDIGRKTLQPIFDFIAHAQGQQKPFFVWYAPMLPHSPHNPPERLLANYRDKTPHLEIAKYWAMCEWYDETCGQLLDYLDQYQLRDNTIVISITDNGWINAEDADRFAPRSKRSTYDGGTRTTITIRWPGHVEPRLDTTHLASSIDLLPTVLAAIGATPPNGLPGINLLDSKAVDGRHAIYGEIFEHDVQHMTDPVASLLDRWVIFDDWKLILPNPARESEAKVELFQITTDPNEQHNVAAANPEITQILTRQIQLWWPISAEERIAPQLPSSEFRP
ncbi:sulfatase-like hydrolase/transferase [Planctomicrobium piriforme]|uniref:Uncharacterized sulfatase n=1 Tax=Planctomicrobium piriforme TaxID=1576369 RepID=A0A1I3MQ49_9PLAN|nr:sulfatase-like hydrolase/transferase [Planctomicrobium piriforme]SFI99103.1 uncharacterized sulfatase [Planctomicrobium piriforme]